MRNANTAGGCAASAARSCAANLNAAGCSGIFGILAAVCCAFFACAGRRLGVFYLLLLAFEF